MNFAQRISPSLPETDAAILDITRRFVDIRYGDHTNPENLKQLKRAIRNLKI